MDERTMCKCGRAFGKHKGGTDVFGPQHRCPGRGEFPRYPHSSARLVSEDHAMEVWDRRLVAYWNQKTTTFTEAP